jgi:hypothetical protein
LSKNLHYLGLNEEKNFGIVIFRNLVIIFGLTIENKL